MCDIVVSLNSEAKYSGKYQYINILWNSNIVIR